MKTERLESNAFKPYKLLVLIILSGLGVFFVSSISNDAKAT